MAYVHSAGDRRVEAEAEVQVEVQAAYEAALLRSRREVILTENDGLWEACRSAEQESESLLEENRDLKERVKRLQVLTADCAASRERELEETQSSRKALQKGKARELELRVELAQLQMENERLEDEVYALSCSLEDSKDERQRYANEARDLQKNCSRLSNCLQERREALMEQQERLVKRSSVTTELQSLTENYASHVELSRERLSTLEKRVAAGPDFGSTAPSIAEEIAQAEAAKEHELQEKEQKVHVNGGSSSSSSSSSSSWLRSILLVLLLLWIIFSTPFQCSSESCHLLGDLLRDAVLSTLGPYCTVHHYVLPPV